MYRNLLGLLGKFFLNLMGVLAETKPFLQLGL